MESLLARIPIIAVDLGVARIHASVWVHLESRGIMISDRDLLIAATAIHYGYGVVTENRREFDRIPGLTVESPNWDDTDSS